jgi:ATP-dependent DNA helicase RecG
VSQLHQLRGRVGRGGVPGLCLLRVTSDGDLIGDARMVASGIINCDPGLAEHRALSQALDRRLREVEAEFLVES